MKQFLLVFSILITIQYLSIAQSNNSEIPTSMRADGVAPHSSAMLDVQSATKGVLIPRMDYASIAAMPNPAIGLMVYDTEFLCLRIYNGADWDCLYQIDSGSAGSVNVTGASYGGNGDDRSFSITTDAVGNHYIGGSFSGELKIANITINASGGGTSGFIAKISAAGNAIWVSEIPCSITAVVNDVFVANNGTVFSTGSFRGTAQFGASSLVSNGTEMFVMKLSVSNSFQWVQRAASTGSSVVGQQVVVANNGNVGVYGSFYGQATFGGLSQTSDGNQDLFLVQYNSSGVPQWVRRMGGSGLDLNGGLDYDSNNALYIGGSFPNDCTFSSDTGSPFSTVQFYDGFTAKYDVNGNFQWKRQIGDLQNQYIENLDVSAFDQIAYAGSFEGSLTLGANTYTSQGNDIFCFLYNPNGSLTNSWQAGGTGFEKAVDIQYEGSSLYVNAQVFGNTQLGGIPFTATNSSLGVIKFSDTGVVQWATVDGGSAEVYPQGIAYINGAVYSTGFFQTGNATFGNVTLPIVGTSEIFVSKVLD